MRLRTRLLAILALLTAITIHAAQKSDPAKVMFEAAKKKELVDGDLSGAIQQYNTIIDKFKNDRAVAADALVHMADCYQKLGDAEARKIYARIVRDYADQPTAVAVARTRLGSEVDWRTLQPGNVASTAQAARQIWVEQSIESPSDNTPSYDGRYIGFTDSETGDLGICDFATGVNHMLTKTAQSVDYTGVSAVSPDGRQIAYQWTLQKELRNELRVLPVNADEKTKPRTVYRSEGSTEYVVPYGWTPDGKQLLVVHIPADRTGSQIALLSVADGAIRVIKSLSWQNPRLSLSPDGHYVAYYSLDKGTKRSIFVLAVDGSHETLVTQGNNESKPVWGPDGKSVLFLDNRTGTVSIWRALIEDGKPKGGPELVKADVGNIDLLAVTRSGALYYVPSGIRRDNIYTAEFGLDPKISNAPSIAIERFMNSTVGSSLSPNGQYLAYYSNNVASGRLRIRTLNTGEDRAVPLQIPAGPLAGAGPMWLSDNQTLLVFAIDLERGGYAIQKLDTISGKSELIRHLKAPPQGTAVSPDGKALFYSMYDPDDPQTVGRLTRVDIATREEVELKHGEWFISLAVSPDSKQLAYLASVRSSGSSYLAIMPSAGGEPHQIFDSSSWTGASRYGTLSWSPDQQALLFVRAGQATFSPNLIWRVPAAGGQAKPTGISIGGPIKNPQIHPDGRRIFFSASELNPREVWSLENFQPALK